MRTLMMWLVCLVGLVTLSQSVIAAEARSTLTWEPPTTRVDGTPYTVDEIAEYRVYYAVDGQPNTDSEIFVVGHDLVTESLTLQLTPRAEPYVVSFAIQVVGVDGLASELSEIVSKTFNVNSTAQPEVPTNLQFTVTCTEGCTITNVAPL